MPPDVRGCCFETAFVFVTYFLFVTGCVTSSSSKTVIWTVT